MSKFAVDKKYALLLRNLGVDVPDILQKAQLKPDLFDAENEWVGAVDYFRLWRILEAELQDPLFSYQAMTGSGIAGYNPLIMGILSSANGLLAFKRLSTYKKLIGPLKKTIIENEDDVEIRVTGYQPVWGVPESFFWMEIFFLIGMLANGTGRRIMPVSVTAPVKPNSVEHALQDGMISTHVKINNELSFRFTRSDLLIPFETNSEKTWLILEPGLQKMLAEVQKSDSLLEQVRYAITEKLPSGDISIKTIATHLGVSSRTLQRRLSEEKCTFQEILETSRSDLADYYLTKTSLPLAEISFQLGYQEQNSFFRAYLGWRGKTPLTVRKSGSIKNSL